MFPNSEIDLTVRNLYFPDSLFLYVGIKGEFLGHENFDLMSAAHIFSFWQICYVYVLIYEQ